MRDHVSRPSQFRWASPVLVAATIGGIAWVGAGDLNPPPGAIQPTNRIQLSDQTTTLPFTIDECGSYILTSCLIGSSASDGIIIDADDVTLDLNGFSLVGVAGSGDGIRVNGTRRNATVENGTVTGWGGHGINAGSGTNGRFEGLSIGSSGLDGLWVGSDGAVHGLNVTGSGQAGIHVGGVRNRVDGNHCTQNGTGIAVDGTDNLIIRNSAAGNGVDYNIGVGNAFGPIAAVGGVGDISVVSQASHPWANFGLTCVPQQWCFDADGDGFGDSANSVVACTAPPSFVADCTDCDDSDVQTNPGATEICDGVDNNCDGQVDEGVGPTWCEDLDSDGFGNAGSAVVSCVQPPSFVSDCTDCNDTDPQTNPGAAEACDGADNDCDGTADNGNPGGGGACNTGQPGVCAAGTLVCQAGALTCQPNVVPSAEVCGDNLDNDCDGVVDEGGCGAGENCCSGVCIDVQSDVNNCGTCGLVCSAAPNSTPSCVAGSCMLTCDGGFGNCNGNPGDGCEVSLNSDNNNCGACGSVCPSGASCVAGACTCPVGTTNCAGMCVDTQSDNNNCGACGNACPGGWSCQSGTCTP